MTGPAKSTARKPHQIFPSKPTSTARKRKLASQEDADDEDEDENDSPTAKRQAIRPGPVLGPASIPNIVPNNTARGSLAANKGISGMKALTDSLTEIQATMANLKLSTRTLKFDTMPALEDRVKEAVNLAKDVERKLDELQTENNELAATVGAHEEDLTKLETRMNDVEVLVNGLEEKLEAADRIPVKALKKKKKTKAKQKDAGNSDADESEDVQKTERNNAFNTVIRVSFWRVMGIEPQSGQLKRALQRSSWMKVKTTDAGGNTVTEEFLRPNFENTWNGNSKWHEKVLGIIRANCVGWSRGAFTEEDLAMYSDTDILEQIATVFKGCKTRYKRERKEEFDRADADQDNRRDGRKTHKATARKAVRHLVPDLMPKQFNWLFVPQYQSSDESQWDEVLSENTDEETHEKAVRNVRSERAWVSRPPTYRSTAVAQFFANLDKPRIAEQKKKRAKTSKGASYHACVIGEPTEKKLPTIEKDENRIRKQFLDPEWMAQEDDDEIMLRVYDGAEDEGENDGEEGQGQQTSEHSEGQDTQREEQSGQREEQSRQREEQYEQREEQYEQREEQYEQREEQHEQDGQDGDDDIEYQEQVIDPALSH